MKERAQSKTSRQRPEMEVSEQVFEIHVREALAGERVDKLIATEFKELSRSTVQELIKRRLVTVNGRSIKASYRLEAGDFVQVREPPSQTVEICAEPIPLTILYEDNSLIVVDKPAGMVTHPAVGHTSGTLVNALLAHAPPLRQMDDLRRAGIVHRLDKDTSGIIVVAKSEAIRRALQAQFKAREVSKTYLALVEGRLEPAQGVIEVPIGRDPKNRKRMAVMRDGRGAITAYRVLEFFDQHCLVQVEPKTGRTHQIRVHMAYVRHPVVGDRVYGYRRQRLPLKRHFLHAQCIGFQHPQSGQAVEFRSDLPPELSALLARLRAQTPSMER